MSERNPTLAGLNLFAGCFATAVGLFMLWSGSAGFEFLALTLVSLGMMTLSLAALGALPDGPSRARTVVRVASIALSAATISLALTAIMAELR